MLLNLPTELLIDIASHLLVSDKLQLALVCKRLKDAIFRECFYRSLHLSSFDSKKTKSIITKFRNERSNGEKVKVLSMPVRHLSDPFFREIPIIFPNVVDFCDRSIEEELTLAIVYDTFAGWKDKIEYLSSIARENTSFIYRLLEKNVFSRLTSLDVSALVNKFGRTSIGFVESLKNAPVLKRLSVRRYTVTLKDIESIHATCPLLTTFRIDFCVILADKDETPAGEIMPALRLTRFELEYSAIYDQQLVFLDYLTRKYTNIIHFNFQPDFAKARLSPLLGAMNIAYSIFDSFNSPKLKDLYSTQEAYYTSASKILSNLSSTLRILQSNLHAFQEPMTIFSRKCINLTRLDFFHPISSPEDIKVLNSLSLLRHASIELDASLQKCELTLASASITHLELRLSETSSDDAMNIGWLLSMFPSLTSLAILPTCTRLIGYEINSTKTYPNLSRLSIEFDAIHSKLLAFLCVTAPNLKDFHCRVSRTSISDSDEKLDDISFCEEPEMGNKILNCMVDLTGFSLNCFHFTNDLYDNDILLELKNKENSKKRFIVSKNASDVCLPSCCSPDVKEKIKMKVTVQYDHTDMFIINSNHIEKTSKNRINKK